ncbi:MAG: flagellar hook-basal body complex protein FliE [Alicyclobacillus sp.]|nr:flagellar hook-basal body complex protein FliE [Alicyclobacillus sp.]
MTVGLLGMSSIAGNAAAALGNQGTNAQASGGTSFAQMLGNAVNQAGDLVDQADEAATTFAAGGPISIDQLMTMEQKASLAVDLVVQIRDRVVSAYQSIMNMQI